MLRRLAFLIHGTLELHLSGFIGTASHPDKQKIRIVWFFLENRLHWQREVEKYIYFRLHIYSCTNKN